MKLHEDKEAFRFLLESIHERSGYRSDVLEKDYYVFLILNELASFQKSGLPAFFKGGTALYKALKTTNRFSEDIDLSVDTRGCSRTQNDKRLAQATKKYVSLPRDSSLGKTNRSEVIAIYTYCPVTIFDPYDTLQRFGQLKVEATSFTISEPVESLEVSAILYDLATDHEKNILKSIYNITPISIQTITLERIFIDKLFAAEAYFRNSSIQHRAFEAAKHIYDLAVIADHPKISKLLASPDQLEYLLDIRIKEESFRLDGIPGVCPCEFSFFTQAQKNQNIHEAYKIMQAQYIFQQQDRISLKKVSEKLAMLENRLLENPSWANRHN